MKEAILNRKAKIIRNKLIYYIYAELKKKSKNNHHYLMINSMTPKELNNKYQKCSDYCVETTETYSSSEMNYGIENNNYFHLSLTYCSLNNNYHMIIDNRNIDQMIGENNIVGKYYKGNSIHIKSTMTKRYYNIINKKDIELEKMAIGDKKFKRKKRVTCSSLNIKKNFLFNDNDNNHHQINLNSNYNNHYNNLINIYTNNVINKKNQTNANKPRKKNQNLYMTKLKKYCSTLKIMKKREKNETNNFHKLKNHKQLELVSPSISERKKNLKKDKNYYLKSEKDQPKGYGHILTNRDNHYIFQTENPNKNNFNSKLKSQTKITQNLFKIKEKKILHKKMRAQSIDVSEGKAPSTKKSSPKKNGSPRKNHSPKKIMSSVPENKDIKFSTLMEKYNNKKSKKNDVIIKKFVSGGIDSKRKMFNANNVIFKSSNNNTDGINILSGYKSNAGNNKKTFNRKLFKRSHTLNRNFKFRGSYIKSKEKEK